jgi:hypothetical protein
MSYQRAVGDTSYDQYLKAGGTPCGANAYYDPNTASCYAIPSAATPSPVVTQPGQIAKLPMSSQGTIAGIPTTYVVLGAVGLALLLALR